jgi:outer membrane protein TolC
MTRFRPVMLTAITTVLGLVPMAVGISFDFMRFKLLIGGASAGFWGPMAIAVIFGLSFATVLTLVFVPTLYTIFDDFGRATRWVTGKVGLRRAPVEALAKVALGAVLVGGALAPSAARAVTLEEAFAAAELNNVDLAIVEEQTIQAQSLVGQGWSLVSPRVSGQVGYTLNELEIAFSPTDGLPPEFAELVGEQEPIVIQQKTQWSANLNVSQPLFSPEALPTLRGAYRVRDAAAQDEAGTRQQVRAGVARAFYALATAREAEALAADAVATAERQLELATRQQAAGVAPRRAVIQAELSVSRARREVATARQQVVSAEEAFARVTGLDRDAALTLPETLDVPESLDGATERALGARPDLQAARLRADAARLEHSAKWLGWLPDVNGSFTVVYNEAAGFGGQKTFWTAGLTGTWTFWDGGLRLAQTRETASRQRAATYAVERGEQVAREEIRVAWEAWRRAAAAVEAVEREVALAHESAALAEAAFRAGTATWLEVEQAELGLRQARMAELQERMSRDLAAIDLRRAIGTL